MPALPNQTYANRFSAGAQIAASCLLDHETLFVALGDGRVLGIVAGEIIWEQTWPDVVLCADQGAIGTDGGRVLTLDASGSAEIIATYKGKWVEQICRHNDLIAYTIGKQLYCTAWDEPRALPQTLHGVAFSPNGKRLAVSHYEGASLLHVTERKITPPVTLKWPGVHWQIIWHKDGKIILTNQQEPTLHGWRLADQADMRMSGYASKINSFKFSADGRYLITSGATQAVAWPFFGGGPWGKTPKMLGFDMDRLVTCVAPHSADPMSAIGYEDGSLIFAPLDEAGILPILSPQKSAVTQLYWAEDGNAFYALLEEGEIFYFTTASVRAGVA